MTEKEFEQILEGHDWYYMMSDDFRIWEKGLKNLNRIHSILRENPQFQDIFNKYKVSV